jgi:hypothetical protein
VRGPGQRDEEAYHLFSLSAINKGEELCISYGELSPDMAMIGYGFTHGNPNLLKDAMTADDNSACIADNTGLSVVNNKERSTSGNVFQLALPIVPVMSRRGKVKFTYEVFEFNDLSIDERIEELLAAGISRNVLCRSVKRRVKVITTMLIDLKNETERMEPLLDQQQHSVKEYIIQAELENLQKVDSFMDNYDTFLIQKSSIIQQRIANQTDECKDIMGYAHLFKESTGIDITNELFNEEDMSTLL